MPSAKVIVNAPPPLPPKTYTLTLELSQREAEALHDLAGKINGSDSKSGRGVTDAIYYALSDAGITSEDHIQAGYSIRFKDYSEVAK